MKSNFSKSQGLRRTYAPEQVIFDFTISARGGYLFRNSSLSLRKFQNEMSNLRQVFLRLVKVSRHRFPVSLRVDPLIFRFLTYSLISLSLKLLCRGISGRFKTSSNSDLFRHRRFNAKSNEANPVLRVKISSNRFSKERFCDLSGFKRYFLRSS